METVNLKRIRSLAAECGFELAGAAPAMPAPDGGRFLDWVANGMAGEMHYLTDHRADLRLDPRKLLPTARAIICIGKLYNVPEPYSTAFTDTEHAWISRYAWADDYHTVLRNGLERMAASMITELGPFDYRICVDTAPLLERSYAQAAGLGWIGKNTCLINQQQGSWFFLGEMLVSLDLAAAPEEAAHRCGSCTRCIDACPTAAIVPKGEGWALDARRCISYFTIELRRAIPENAREGMGRHIFGCDICQDVCPWNGRAAVTSDPGFRAEHIAPPLEKLAALTEEDFREMFRRSPVWRTRYSGFLRNVAIAMGNSGAAKFREPLEKLSASTDSVVAEHAKWALGKISTAI